MDIAWDLIRSPELQNKIHTIWPKCRLRSLQVGLSCTKDFKLGNDILIVCTFSSPQANCSVALNKSADYCVTASQVDLGN